MVAPINVAVYAISPVPDHMVCLAALFGLLQSGIVICLPPSSLILKEHRPNYGISLGSGDVSAQIGSGYTFFVKKKSMVLCFCYTRR